MSASLAGTIAVWWMISAAALFLPPEGPTDTHERPSVIINEQVFQRLQDIQNRLENGETGPALTRLENLLGSDRLNAYERALAYQTLAQVHLQAGRDREAIAAFLACLDQQALPGAAQQSVRLSLANLKVREGRHAEAIEQMRHWFRYERSPVADAYILVASAYAELGDHDVVLPWVREAIARAPEPREPWYQLKLVALLELGAHEAAISWLARMLELWPLRPQYWDTLSSLYLELERDEQALGALSLAYRLDLLSSPSRLLALARLKGFLGQPFAAGELLSRELEAGRLPRERETLELLARTWSLAHETERADAIFAELARMTGEGRFDLERAQLLAADARWAAAVSAAEAALSAPSPATPGPAWLLIGISHAELGHGTQAREALERARRSDETLRPTADAWLGWLAADHSRVSSRR